jgi:hypothetical protein
MQVRKQTIMKCKWYNTWKIPTYLYLPVESGHPILVGFEEASADRHCAPLSLQCRQVIRVIDRLSSDLKRAKPKMIVSFDISRLPFIGIPHPNHISLLVLFDSKIGRSLNNLGVLCRWRWVGFYYKDFLL